MERRHRASHSRRRSSYHYPPPPPPPLPSSYHHHHHNNNDHDHHGPHDNKDHDMNDIDKENNHPLHATVTATATATLSKYYHDEPSLYSYSNTNSTTRRTSSIPSRTSRRTSSRTSSSRTKTPHRNSSTSSSNNQPLSRKQHHSPTAHPYKYRPPSQPIAQPLQKHNDQPSPIPIPIPIRTPKRRSKSRSKSTSQQSKSKSKPPQRISRSSLSSSSPSIPLTSTRDPRRSPVLNHVPFSPKLQTPNLSPPQMQRMLSQNLQQTLLFQQTQQQERERKEKEYKEKKKQQQQQQQQQSEQQQSEQQSDQQQQLDKKERKKKQPQQQQYPHVDTDDEEGEEEYDEENPPLPSAPPLEEDDGDNVHENVPTETKITTTTKTTTTTATSPITTTHHIATSPKKSKSKSQSQSKPKAKTKEKTEAKVKKDTTNYNHDKKNKKFIIPAYAFKNAQTGLLEIREMIPPSPSEIAMLPPSPSNNNHNQNNASKSKHQKLPPSSSSKNNNHKNTTIRPALYPIALNGGAVGVYSDPSHFGLNAITPFLGTNSGITNNNVNLQHLPSRRMPLSSHLEFPSEIRDSLEHGVSGVTPNLHSFLMEKSSYHNNNNNDKKKTKQNRHSGSSGDKRSRASLEEEEESDDNKIKLHNVPPEWLSNLNKDIMNMDGTEDPWKQWEKVHMEMTRLAVEHNHLRHNHHDNHHYDTNNNNTSKRRKTFHMSQEEEENPNTNALPSKDTDNNNNNHDNSGGDSSSSGDDDNHDLLEFDEHFTQKHKVTTGRMSSAYNQDDYDFALVLYSNRIYHYWAQHLDFRSEHYISDNDDDEHDESDLQYYESSGEEYESNYNHHHHDSEDAILDRGRGGLPPLSSTKKKKKMTPSLKHSHSHSHSTPPRSSLIATSPLLRRRDSRTPMPPSSNPNLHSESNLNPNHQERSLVRNNTNNTSNKACLRTLESISSFQSRQSISSSYALVAKQTGVDSNGRRIFTQRKSLFERAMDALTPTNSHHNHYGGSSSSRRHMDMNASLTLTLTTPTMSTVDYNNHNNNIPPVRPRHSSMRKLRQSSKRSTTSARRRWGTSDLTTSPPPPPPSSAAIPPLPLPPSSEIRTSKIMTTTPNTNSANKHKNKTSPLIPRQRHLMTPPINSITDTGVSFRIHNYDNNNPSNSNKKKKRNNRSSQRQPLGGGNPSVFLGSTTPTPTQQIQRQRQRQKQRRDKRSKHNANNVGNNSRALTLTSNHGDHTDNTDDNDEDDDLKYNFPSQVIPRGIAARTNGMQVFLQALFRGIVVRRHVPHGVAEFVMLSSKDGGDTISYEYIPEEEARVALLEQRVRFNRNHKKYKSQWLMNSFHDDRWSIMQMNGNTAATNNNNNNHHGGAGAGDITPKSGISQQPSVCCQQNPPHQNPQQPQQQQQQQQQQPQQNQIYSHGHGYGGCKDHKSDWSSSYNNNNNNHHPTLPPREAAAPSATSSSTNIPNHIIAHYQNQMQDGIFHKLSDYSTKFIHSGKIHAKDVVAVHPARHEDPFRSQERLMKQEMKLLQKQQKQLARQSQQEDENMNKNEEEEADLENPMVFVDNELGNNNDSDNDDSDDDEGDSEDDAEYYGTWTLRKSKTQYCRDCAFSLILPQTRLKDAFYTAADTIKGKKSYFTDPQENINISSNSEKWYAGIGSMSSFRTLDLEAATEGEYWTIFRGFLLLHRDAASGRFAAERASGFSSHYNKLKREMEEKERNDNENKKNKYKCDEEEDYRIRWWHSLYPHVWRQEIQHKLENRAPVVAPPSDYFLGFKSSGTQIWSRLRQAGLETHRIYALDTNRVMIKVRCPPERLQDVAEVLKIKLRTVDGSFLPFQESIASQFLSSDEYSQRYAHHPSGTPNLFRSSDRQNIIDFIIRSRIRDSGAELGETSQLGKQIQMRVPLHMHAKLESLYVSWVTFWHKQNWIGRDGKSMTVGPDKYNQENANNNNNIVDPCIDMGDSHLSNNNTNISNNKVLSTRTLVSENAPPRGYFSRLIIGSFYQPLDSIQEYFGEGVAYYFAWLQHCSYHLVSLSVFGIIVTVCQIMSGTWDHPIRPYFSVVVMLWGLFVMITWRRRSNYLAHKWGTLNFEEEETTRPQFKGEYRRCDITQEWVIFYPAWKRWLKFCFSVPLTLAFTLLSTIGILIVHANRDIMLARHFELKHQIMEDGLSSSLIQSNATFALDLSIHAIGRKAPLTAVDFNLELIQDVEFWTIVVGFPTILGVCYPLFNYILMKISVMLNDFENHRTESQYRNQLVLKVFSLRFVCYFSSLYYYSFVLPEDTEQATENAIFRVATSLIVYLTVAHWWNIIVVIYAPLMLHRWKLHKERSRLRKELRSLELMRWDYSQSLNTRNGTNMDHLEANLEANKKTSPLPTFRSDSVNEEQDLEKKIANRRVLLEQAQDSVWEEIMLPTYDSFYDYVLATIQFGYVTCFSVVLPFTPVICLINNLLSMRLDAYKLCRGRRRPLVTKAGGIGVWEHVLHIVTVISILTNCSLMALTSNLGNTIKERIGDVGLFFVVVGWEHFMLLIKYIMQAAVPTMPQSVISDKMREKHQRAQQNRFSMRAKKERRSAGVTATHSFASNDEFHRESIKTEHLESGLLEKTKSPANETVYSKSNISTQTVVRSNTTTAQTNTEIGQDKQTQFSPPIESVKDIVRRLNSVGKPPQKKQLSPLRSWKQKRRMSPKRSPRRNNNSNVNPSSPTRIAKSPLQTLRRRMTRSNSLKRGIEKRKKAPLPLTPTRASRKSPPVKLTATLSSRTRRRTILDQGISSLSPTSDTYSEYYTPVQQKLDFDSSSPLLKPQRSVHSPITQHNIPAESPFDGKERVNGEDDEIGEIELLNDIASVQTSLFGEKVIERDPKHAIENGSDDDFLLADFDAAPANTIKNESKLRGPLLTKVEFDKENELGIVNTLSNLTEGDTMKFVNSSRRRRRKY